ncbi:peroxisome assembly protein 26 [Megalops cyprinoides]|uniref:peroxisome assembly protein 26 n=1 Tax=Megalops cyprinoides TaxID=118141 RepID=UPI001864631B|nr:peroxisome assembly protein 26 [Megalops cyprinoides]
MRSSSSTSLARVRSLGSVRLSSPPICSGSAQVLGLLDLAAEQLMVRRDFQTAFDTCERGLDSLGSVGEQGESSSRYGELKAALCVVAIQALAELNQWRRVLAWVIQQYGRPEKIPAKIVQLCILLYAKVGEPATMQEVGHDWLKFHASGGVPAFGTVAELYLIHVLLPLGRLAEARELVVGEVGVVAFTEEQRRTALDIVESQESCRPGQSPSPSPSPLPSPAQSTQLSTHRGAATQRLQAVLQLVYRGLSVAKRSLRSFPLRRVLLAAFLLYLLLVRLDPALPSSFPWLSRLLQMFRQMWDTMFAPYYRASAPR